MTRDEFLTTKVLGECWHDGIYHEIAKCTKCSIPYPKNLNFSTPEGFFKLWNFCKAQEWFRNDFVMRLPTGNYINIDEIDPDEFADGIASSRGWKGE